MQRHKKLKFMIPLNGDPNCLFHTQNSSRVETARVKEKKRAESRITTKEA